MTDTTPNDQMMLLSLPPIPSEAPVAAKNPRRPRSEPAVSAPNLATEPRTSLPDALSGIALVDPRFVTVDPVNARHGLAFDPEAQAELITSMRAVGNTVPVRLRPDTVGTYLCPSGSQRLGAALHIQREQPGFRLRAIIAETMDDREAFALGEADNAGRTNVQPMRQARKWAEALDTIYGGDRQAFIAATGRSASVVSRTLALASLLEHILACCSDVEGLTPYFAEQLSPRLADPDQEMEVRRRAEALTSAGRRLPGAKLIRVLLENADRATPELQIVWQSADGARSVRYRAAGKGGRIDFTSPESLSAAERRNVVKAFDTLLRELGTTTPVL